VREARERIENPGDDPVRTRLCHFFDVHAARGAAHDHQSTGALVQDDRQVDLALDFGHRFDHERGHGVSLKLRPQELLRDGFRLGAVFGDPNAANLAPAAGRHLGLEDGGERQVGELVG
jgi:hypothetical protein